jgi:ferric-dicitrate binding protein FerR (iron transport regulator)
MIERSHTDLDLRSKVELSEWMVGLLLSDDHSVDEILDEVRLYLADDRDSKLKQEILSKLFLVAFQSGRSDGTLPISVVAKDMWSEIATTLEMNPDLHHYSKTRQAKKSIKALRRPVWRSTVIRTIAAAMIPVLIVVGATWLLSEDLWKTKGKPSLTDVKVSVPVLGQKRIVLPDGSQVWANSSTTISYSGDFSKERTVRLDGEAFFSVVHDSLSPFRVKTTDMVIEVLGTEFNVHSRSGETTEQVVLTEGSVKVDLQHSGEMRLTPGERLTYDTESSEASIDRIDVETIASWRVTDLCMVDMPLSEALERIAVYYGRTLSVPAEWSSNELVNLSNLDNYPLQHVLDAVCDITNNSFNYQITKDRIKITPGSQHKE